MLSVSLKPEEGPTPPLPLPPRDQYRGWGLWGAAQTPGSSHCFLTFVLWTLRWGAGGGQEWWARSGPSHDGGTCLQGFPPLFRKESSERTFAQARRWIREWRYRKGECKHVKPRDWGGCQSPSRRPQCPPCALCWCAPWTAKPLSLPMVRL